MTESEAGVLIQPHAHLADLLLSHHPLSHHDHPCLLAQLPEPLCYVSTTEAKG